MISGLILKNKVAFYFEIKASTSGKNGAITRKFVKLTHLLVNTDITHEF